MAREIWNWYLKEPFESINILTQFIFEFILLFDIFWFFILQIITRFFHIDFFFRVKSIRNHLIKVNLSCSFLFLWCQKPISKWNDLLLCVWIVVMLFRSQMFLTLCCLELETKMLYLCSNIYLPIFREKFPPSGLEM